MCTGGVLGAEIILPLLDAVAQAPKSSPGPHRIAVGPVSVSPDEGGCWVMSSNARSPQCIGVTPSVQTSSWRPLALVWSSRGTLDFCNSVSTPQQQNRCFLTWLNSLVICRRFGLLNYCKLYHVIVSVGVFLTFQWIFLAAIIIITQSSQSNSVIHHSEGLICNTLHSDEHSKELDFIQISDRCNQRSNIQKVWGSLTNDTVVQILCFL